MTGLIGKMFTWAKSVLLERGHLVYWLNIPAFRSARRQVLARPKKEKARVGFVLQEPNSWASIQSVYEAVKADPDMEPVVLLVPEMEFAFYVKVKKVIWEATYAFGKETFTEGCIQTYNPETGEWVDPAKLDLDYVFYSRPYETYLPKPYRAKAMKRLCRTCFVPYSSPLLGDYPLMYNMHFIRNLHMVFCEKQKSYDYVRGRLGLTVRSGDQHVFLVGFPKFDLNWNMEGVESTIWPRPREKGRLRILWTPRWTTDPRLCGSNFMNYKEEIISWAEHDQNLDLVFRPHPMGLWNYVHSGLMTQEELDQYLARYEACGNAAVDRRPTYYDTFWSSDVLVTDMSSVMMDYMLTGRPIVFCPTPIRKLMSDDPRYDVGHLVDGLYIVHSFAEIQETVQALARGDDPRRETRMRLANMMRRNGKNGQNVADALHADYFGQQA